MPDLIDWSQPLQFDASGKPFLITASGKRSYLPPATAAQMSDPRAQQWAASMGEVLARDASGTVTGLASNAAPDASFTKSRGEWNPTTGQFDQSINQGGLGGLIEGSAAVAAPLIIGPALANLAAGGVTSAATGSASGGGGSAAGAGGAAVLPSTSTGAAMSTTSMAPVVGTGGSVAGETGFLASMQNLLTDPKFLFNTGANVLGGYMSSRAAGKAADQQAKAAQASLDLQRNIYEQGRADQMPWLNAGRGSVTTLQRLMGVDSNPASTMPMTSSQQAVQRNPMQQLAGGGEMVTMRAPDGSTRPVPAAMVGQLEARGAQRV